MSNNIIHQKARRIVSMCSTHNPIKIAREIGIHVKYNNEFEDLKGMYIVIDRSRFIILNNNLSERECWTVCAHEIGHDQLHRNLAKAGALQEFMLYDMRLRPEYEANIFAADLLINDDYIFELIDNGFDIEQIARELNVDMNLVLIKIDSLRLQGYDVRAPYRPRSDFLGRG